MRPRPPLPAGPYLVVGLARSGVAACLALRGRGETVMGVDGAVPSTGIDLLRDAGVELHTRQADGRDLLDRARAVVKSPGVPAEAPVIAAARAGGMAVMGELELAWRMLDNEFIAVTGTNGKTTTVELIGHIHRHARVPVAVAGNVGVALSSLVSAGEPASEAQRLGVAGSGFGEGGGGLAPGGPQTLARGTVVVCEASSFQLEDTIAFAPEAAVLLNIAQDHLDRHGTLERYTAAKLEIFARQERGGVAVLPTGLDVGPIGGDARHVRFGLGERAELSLVDGWLRWEGRPLLAAAEVRLRGAHNLQNAMAAAAACLARGLDPDAVRAGLHDFPGVAHRLEEVATVGGVLYVNDSKATNVASTLVALDAMLDGGMPAHLIAGGQGKGQDFAPLAASVQRGCRAVYLIGEDAALVERGLQGTDVPLVRCGQLESALEAASAAAGPGDAVLLSPGCASLDQFSDYEARGARFRELVGGIRDAM
jgi:UDP-N-acetylmuramoylalanine--D-glutamate ligase